MNDDVMTIRFPAVLEDMSGQVIEYGSAEFAPEPNSLNFISGFIPLYPMGTKIAVVWLRDDNRLERLRGEVYLSSRTLLRVTGIDPAKMQRIYRLFYSNIKLKARLFMPSPQKPWHRLFRRKQAASDYVVDATIYYLSETEMKFLCIDPLDVGFKMVLNLDSPVGLQNISVQVREVSDFGNIVKAYLCDIVSAPEELGKFVASLNDED